MKLLIKRVECSKCSAAVCLGDKHLLQLAWEAVGQRIKKYHKVGLLYWKLAGFTAALSFSFHI
jgi:hypothetical protein